MSTSKLSPLKVPSTRLSYIPLCVTSKAPPPPVMSSNIVCPTISPLPDWLVVTSLPSSPAVLVVASDALLSTVTVSAAL